MDLNQNNAYYFRDIININEQEISIENQKYLYPNGHRITHQMRWFKGSRDRCLRSDIAA